MLVFQDGIKEKYFNNVYNKNLQFFRLLGFKKNKITHLLHLIHLLVGRKILLNVRPFETRLVISIIKKVAFNGVNRPNSIALEFHTVVLRDRFTEYQTLNIHRTAPPINSTSPTTAFHNFRSTLTNHIEPFTVFSVK